MADSVAQYWVRRGDVMTDRIEQWKLNRTVPASFISFYISANVFWTRQPAATMMDI